MSFLGELLPEVSFLWEFVSELSMSFLPEPFTLAFQQSVTDMSAAVS